MTSRQPLLKQFSDITGASSFDAEHFLEYCQYNLELAVSTYFDRQGGGQFGKPQSPGTGGGMGQNIQSYGQGQDAAFMQQLALLQMYEREKNRPKPTGEGKASVVVCEHVTPSGNKIQVRHGDMTEEDVGAIVNAANKHLDHASGLAGAIRIKGGPIIQQESDAYILKNGPLEEGAVVSLSSGNLKCKHVLHAVGPMWNGGQYGEPVYLSMCIRGCLDKANELKVTSISMPAVSTGIFKFPKPTCAEIMFNTVLHYFAEEKGKTTVNEVRFTNYDDDTVLVFKKEFEKRFGEVLDKPETKNQS